MTAAAQNEAIARWMDWTFVPGRVLTPDQWVSPTRSAHSLPPNYVGDLNEIFDAVAKLPDGLYEDFGVHLVRVIFGNTDRGYDMRPVNEATAAQRAEALLRALSLWKEGE